MLGFIKKINALNAIAWLLLGSTMVMAAGGNNRPNIVVIWGDDIGIWNISTYTRGIMGYQTPNIDRIASEGVIFTDYLW